MNEEKKRLSIGFLTALDPQDRHSWSGTVYYMARALQKHCGELSYLGPMRPVEELVGKVMHKSAQLFLKKNYRYYTTIAIARKYAKIARRKLIEHPVDVIVAPSAATEMALLETDIPIVLIEDATFALLHNYYSQYSNLVEHSARESHAVQAAAIKNADLLIYSSEWAAQSAIETYHANSKNVHIIPFGANFDTPPPKEIIYSRKKVGRCRLLFMGVNWQRKGGDIAFETFLKLEEMGIQSEFIVCGCVPPNDLSHERMKIIPFLNKNDEMQRKELDKLFLMADFLLLPTRNDCTPIVFCEASSFGLPIITTNTGGVPGVIEDGENGYMLPLSARGPEYANLIASIYRDEQRYAALVQSSRAAFESRLNWDAWGIAVNQLIMERLALRNEHSTFNQLAQR